MMHLKKLDRRRKVKFNPEDSGMNGPDYELEVRSLRKKFLISSCEGYFRCDFKMTPGQVLSLDAIAMPDTLYILFHYDKKFAGAFELTSILKEGDCLKCTYQTSIAITSEIKNFKWSFQAYYKALKKEILEASDMELKEYAGPFSDGSPEVTIKINSPIYQKVSDCVKHTNARLVRIHKNAQITLGNVKWKQQYEKNEKLFCIEILAPLFRKIGFQHVVFNHGKKEFGKDFTFSELDKFGQIKYFGVQVKSGNFSGEANSKIDEVIGQIKDAFEMPYYDVNSKTPRYVTTILIIISGNYTENAKEKILQKLNKGLYGSVYFMGKQEIVELVEKYWAAE